MGQFSWPLVFMSTWIHKQVFLPHRHTAHKWEKKKKCSLHQRNLILSQRISGANTSVVMNAISSFLRTNRWQSNQKDQTSCQEWFWGSTADSHAGKANYLQEIRVQVNTTWIVEECWRWNTEPTEKNFQFFKCRFSWYQLMNQCGRGKGSGLRWDHCQSFLITQRPRARHHPLPSDCEGPGRESPQRQRRDRTPQTKIAEDWCQRVPSLNYPTQLLHFPQHFLHSLWQQLSTCNSEKSLTVTQWGGGGERKTWSRT